MKLEYFNIIFNNYKIELIIPKEFILFRIKERIIKFGKNKKK